LPDWKASDETSTVLASGFLTGKYRPGVAVDSARSGGAAQHLNDPANVALLETLDEIAAAHSVGVTAVVLAWARQQPGIGAPIASGRTVDQLTSLVESFTLTLTPEDLLHLS
jgi:aryl-alcohol dehydrogenase-like predicted oxidoreductase